VSSELHDTKATQGVSPAVERQAGEKKFFLQPPGLISKGSDKQPSTEGE
jgi:hypothetical protein